MSRLFRLSLTLLVGMSALIGAASSTAEAQHLDDLRPGGDLLPEASADTIDKDVPYVATSQRVVERMLEVADVSKEDVVVDLGSGDGRIPITAAKQFGARGLGVEIDPELVAKARAKAEAAGVSDQVEFRQGDLFQADLRDATVVTLYLWPEINAELRPKLLRELDPGDRIVSHDFRMGTWEPDRRIEAGKDKTGTATLYLWIVPEKVPEDLKETAGEGGPN